MNVKVHDLMVEQVMTTTPGQTVGHVREVMQKHRISSMPVIGGDDEPVGVITTSDLIGVSGDGARVSQVMSDGVYSVPQYSDVSVAARIMRNHKIHHVVVTHEKRVVGLLSSFDLLKLVEDHRFALKNAPTPKKRGIKQVE